MILNSIVRKIKSIIGSTMYSKKYFKNSYLQTFQILSCIHRTSLSFQVPFRFAPVPSNTNVNFVLYNSSEITININTHESVQHNNNAKIHPHFVDTFTGIENIFNPMILLNWAKSNNEWLFKGNLAVYFVKEKWLRLYCQQLWRYN